jgi:hypothetical protein
MSSIVMSFWNSPEQLSTALRWLTIVGLAFTAIFGAAIYFVNDRIGALQSQTVQAQSERLSQQTERIGHLNDELSAVRTQEAELQKRAQNAERGVSDSYDFNGAHRQTTGGRIAVTVGAETMVFRNLMDFYNAKNWQGLADTCERQIQATPNWLTPYLYSGLAYANLGNFGKAQERLEFVAQKAGADPNYSDAARVLEQIKSATHR